MGMKRKRRVEITRYSRRIIVMHGEDAADFAAAAETTAADIALKMSADAPFALVEVNGGKPACKAAAEMPLRRHLLRFFAWLKRQG